ncbi:MAG: sigma-70 family RNA polymerase sigma factor [Planctomycetota bacterium]|nr:sigma-70 family RNA polymerase sigma factor [Planctomycetota bacterium]
MDSQTGFFRQLLHNVRSGCEVSTAELVESMSGHICRVIDRRLDYRLRRKYDVDDLEQMVWASFFRLRWRVTDFEDSRHLARYLVAMARNKVIQVIRSQLQTIKRDVRREWAAEEEHLGQVANQGTGQTPSQIAIRNEYLQRWLSEENSRVVRIVKMRLAGTCYTEIAGSLGIHQRTVRRIMQRLVKRLGAN